MQARGCLWLYVFAADTGKLSQSPTLTPLMLSKRSLKALGKSKSSFSAAGQDRTSILCRTRVIHRGARHGDKLMARQIQTQTRAPARPRANVESKVLARPLHSLSSTVVTIRITTPTNTVDITDMIDLVLPVLKFLRLLLRCRHRCHGTLMATHRHHIRTTRRSTAPVLPFKAQEQRPQS